MPKNKAPSCAIYYTLSCFNTNARRDIQQIWFLADFSGIRWPIGFPTETTMPLAWIATRLRMGNAGYVKWLLLQAKKGAICQ